MQNKQTLVRLLIILSPLACFGQSTYLHQGDKSYHFMERMEIKSRSDSFFNFSKTRPFTRRHIVEAAKHYQLVSGDSMSSVDRANIRSIYLDNNEYLTDEERAGYLSKKPLLKNFYKTPANLYEVHTGDFDLIINPVFQYTISKESDNDQHLFLNSRGLTLRGRIAKKIGFSTYLTDNQERPPLYVQQFITERSAVPGAGFYKPFKAAGGVDYFDARGHITFNVTRYIDIQFGYDNNFIGNGYRSMFLSDFGNNNLYLKLNTRIWKINYQNLFMELQTAHIPGGDRLIGKKYAAMHHLDVGVTKWLNIGVFEGVIFGRRDRFDFGYLNPIIFYRSIEQQNGSFDNSIIGLDAKANIARRFQVYGQLALDEFLLAEIKRNRGWWANKWAIQIGGKYIDAFGIKNLDLQVEHNRVRPFTYSHRDSVANYTHYNQPLAHPLMANFQEFIGILRYQPIPKLYITGKLIGYRQGRDTGSISYGSNIFLPNTEPYRVDDFGFNIGSGWMTDVIYGSLLLSYELKQNLFIEGNAVFRKQETKSTPIMSENSSIISIGLRWNMHRRDFEF
jgi:hypothetical protein